MTGGLQKRLGCCEESSEGVTGSKHVWTSQMSIKLRGQEGHGKVQRVKTNILQSRLLY